MNEQEREFSVWLDSKRSLSVSEVFHEIVERAALAAKVPNLTGLVHRLRGGGWDLRTPQEMADMIADMIESAAKPAQAQQAAEPLAWLKHHPGALKPTTVPGCTFLAEDALAMGWEPLGRIAAAKAKPEAQQPEHRLLGKGDVLQGGDECLLDDCKSWAPITAIFHGHPYMPGFHVPHRRPVAQEAGIGASGEASNV